MKRKKIGEGGVDGTDQTEIGQKVRQVKIKKGAKRVKVERGALERSINT